MSKKTKLHLIQTILSKDAAGFIPTQHFQQNEISFYSPGQIAKIELVDYFSALIAVKIDGQWFAPVPPCDSGYLEKIWEGKVKPPFACGITSKQKSTCEHILPRP